MPRFGPPEAAVALAAMGGVIFSLASAHAQGPLGPTCPNYPIVNGCWSGSCYPGDPDSVEAIHAALLHTGKVLLWGYGRAEAGGLFAPSLWLWTPGVACGTWEKLQAPWDDHDAFFPSDPPGACWIDPTCLGDIAEYSPFCSGHDYDKDGKLVVVSGHEDRSPDGEDQHSSHSLYFDPVPKTWTKTCNTLTQRWYSSVRMDPASRRMWAWNGAKDDDCEVSPQYNTWPEELVPNLGGQWLPRLGPGSQPCHDPMSAYAPLVSTPRSPSQIWPDYASTGGYWLAVSQTDDPPTAPAETWLVWPGTGTDCNWRGTSDPPFNGRGLTNVQHREGPFLIPPFSPDNPYSPEYRYLNGPNLWLIGGHQSDAQKCGSTAPHGVMEVFGATSLEWNGHSILNYPRADHLAVLLPDSTIFVVGGGLTGDCCNPSFPYCPPGYTPVGTPGQPTRECAQLTPEIFDPASTAPNQWRPVNPHRWPRMHHATALLLPDGSVFVGGGEYLTGEVCPPDWEQSDRQKSIEIYKPPYFFDNSPARPVITSVVTPEVSYGGEIQFYVQNWDPGDGRVMLIRPGSITHHHEMSQRTVYLPITLEQPAEAAYKIKARIPQQTPLEDTDGDILPAGPYMLWVVRDWVGLPATNNIGKRQPCVQAAWVKVIPGAGFAGPPGGRGGPQAAPGRSPRPTLAVLGAVAPVEIVAAVPERWGKARLAIYDVGGRHLATVAEGLAAGEHRVEWKGVAASGREVPAGVYFVRLESEAGEAAVKKLVLLAR